MFIGHFGVALAGKKLAPRTSLGSLFFAAQFLDLVWPVFLLAGLEHVRIAPGITRMSLEVAIFAAGCGLYLSATRARDKLGRYALWALLLFLFVGWVASLAAGAPPSDRAMAWGALSMWVVVPWAWWADRHREPIV